MSDIAKCSSSPTKKFHKIVESMSGLGFEKHEKTLLKHALQNKYKIKKSFQDLMHLQGEKAKSAIVISAGPSLHRRQSISKILKSTYKGTVIATDGSYLACLKAGLIPDFLLTLDPHATRIVRWFGDYDFSEHANKDDYFKRQDLDVAFRKDTYRENERNIETVNKYGLLTRAIVSTSSPKNVVQRIEDAKFDTYWWNPLVDNPREKDSLTRKLYNVNPLDCMNTGGTVGTAAWVFASSVLKIPFVALVGMDHGYYNDTPFSKTQTYYEFLLNAGSQEQLKEYFCRYTFPLTGEQFYSDATYFWYRKNFFDLFKKVKNTTYNCTEGGTLFSPGLACIYLDTFLKENRA